MIELLPIRPSIAIELQLKKQLRTVILQMNKEFLELIANNKTYYKTHLVIDYGNPISLFLERITAFFESYEDIFTIFANQVSPKTVAEIDNNNKFTYMRSFNKMADKSIIEQLTVRFSRESQKQLLANQSLIEQQVSLIKTIPIDKHQQVLALVNEAITRGRDYNYLITALQHNNQITTNRAKLIAHNQIHTATGIINRARQSALGIMRSKWKHSTASKEPRISHLHANNKIFDNDKGCLIDGKYIIPGQLPGCNCYSLPILEI
jgi:uncharacterized protein with gpF-like domain